MVQSLTRLRVWTEFVDGRGDADAGARLRADGSPYGGQRFSCGALYLMLKNRIYRGEIVHKGKAFPGEHAAIVDEDLWRRVQRRLEENRMERREGDKALEPSLLAGIVFDASSEPMTPTHAVKKGTRYRYYISRRLITGPASDSSRGQRVPASNLEALVIGRLRALLADPVEFLNAISNGERDAPMQKRLRDAAAALSARWEHLPTETQYDFARSILVRAQVHADRIDLEIGSARLVSWLLNDSAGEGIVEGNRASNANADGSEQTQIRLSIRASLKRTGKEMKFIVEGVTNSAPADTTLIRLLVRGQKIAKRMFESNCPPLEAIAHEERIAASYATRLVRLAFLAPDIVAATLAGKQPPGLTANKLMADTRLPLDWRDQRAALALALERLCRSETSGARSTTLFAWPACCSRRAFGLEVVPAIFAALRRRRVTTMSRQRFDHGDRIGEERSHPLDDKTFQIGRRNALTWRLAISFFGLRAGDEAARHIVPISNALFDRVSRGHGFAVRVDEDPCPPSAAVRCLLATPSSSSAAFSARTDPSSR